MKNLMVMAALSLFSFGAQSQVEVDGTNINDLDIQYIEMVGQSKVLSLTKIKIFIDFGQDFSFKQQTVRTADGKNAAFNSIVDALNSIHSEMPVVCPIHPRTRGILKKLGIDGRL